MPHPLAVGLFRFDTGTSDLRRRRARIEIALCAGAEGYALLDTFDLNGSLHGEEETLQAVRALAARHALHALIVAGPVDRDGIDGLADELRLITVRVPGSRL
ncbi:hypothetical protein KIH74_24540 [Kineosporia sp. J2-2]|uniref:Recombinase family protein n=1 Tax=Kineosporia corallincola TaxID=2835133 RepID=A0ABS5TMA7_9ACTN|nr:hypothetical protein [Kineosporia corallincola]MBT0772135.1 hypothetical protein [Kineosporia corallincola]